MIWEAGSSSNSYTGPYFLRNPKTPLPHKKTPELYTTHVLPVEGQSPIPSLFNAINDFLNTLTDLSNQMSSYTTSTLVTPITAPTNSSTTSGKTSPVAKTITSTITRMKDSTIKMMTSRTGTSNNLLSNIKVLVTASHPSSSSRSLTPSSTQSRSSTSTIKPTGLPTIEPTSLPTSTSASANSSITISSKSSAISKILFSITSASTTKMSSQSTIGRQSTSNPRTVPSPPLHVTSVSSSQPNPTVNSSTRTTNSGNSSYGFSMSKVSPKASSIKPDGNSSVSILADLPILVLSVAWIFTAFL
ncbi:uncharacterized protein [Eleutherodactylus coqui]|uniref:uncharacterized protein isoform X2 n=1 Tax=Eleutherodactylus coqui TaxID=57060 RepID=UPI003461A375